MKISNEDLITLVDQICTFIVNQKLPEDQILLTEEGKAGFNLACDFVADQLAKTLDQARQLQALMRVHKDTLKALGGDSNVP